MRRRKKEARLEQYVPFPLDVENRVLQAEELEVLGRHVEGLGATTVEDGKRQHNVGVGEGRGARW